MSGGYDIIGCQLFHGNSKVALSEDARQRMTCVSCRKLLRDPFQCHCSHGICQACKPSGKFYCRSCGRCIDPTDKKQCHLDKACRKEINELKILCRCNDKKKLSFEKWKSHACAGKGKEVEPAGAIFPEGLSEDLRSSQPQRTTISQLVPPPQQPLAHDERLGAFKHENLNASVTTGSLEEQSSLPAPSESTRKSPQEELAAEVDRDLKENLQPDCNPQVVLICNLNDVPYPEESIATPSSPPANPASTEPKKPLPKLDAEKSRDFLLPELLSMGFLVLLVINKSSDYLYYLLKALKNIPEGRGLPKPVPLLMLISSTHGSCNSIYMNGESFRIPSLMKQLASIDCLHIFALIECCQHFGKSLSIDKVGKPYSIVYSVQPECISRHCSGVGFLIRSAKKVLKNGYTGYAKSVTEFVDDLRSELDDIFRKVYKEDYEKEKEELVHVSVSGNVNFSELIKKALEPELEILSRDIRKIVVKIKCPKRLVKHPDKKKFELTHILVFLESDTMVEILHKQQVEFGSTSEQSLELPPRVLPSGGVATESLVAMACYGDGNNERSQPERVELPTYKSPKISSCVNDKCKRTIAFTAKEENVVDSLKYKVDSINWCLLPTGQWQNMDGVSACENEQNYDVQLPHCYPNSPPIKANLQVATFHKATSTHVPSKPFEVELPELEVPSINRIKNSLSCTTKMVKVTTNQCDCTELTLEQCGVLYNDGADRSDKLGEVKHFITLTTAPREVELTVPFRATTIKPFVKYEGFNARVVGDPRPSNNGLLQKFINVLVNYASRNKCKTAIWIVGTLLLLFGVTASLGFFMADRPQVNKEIIESNTTISHPSLKFSLLDSIRYEAFHVTYKFQNSSDRPGMIVSLFEAPSITRLKHSWHPVNKPYRFKDNGKHCLFGLNEYNNPLFLLVGSNISGRASIEFHSIGCTLHSAKLFGLKEYHEDKTVPELCSAVPDTIKPLFHRDIKQGLYNQSWPWNAYTTVDDSYVYTFVQVDASCPVTVNLEISYQIVYYPDLTDGAIGEHEVVDNVSLDHIAMVPISFYEEVQYYMYAYPLKKFGIAHLEITRIPRLTVLIAVWIFTVPGTLVLLVTCLYSCCTRRWRCCRNARDRNADPNETRPFVNG